MQIQALGIPDVKLIEPTRFGDERGFFSETYHQNRLWAAGIDAVFVQDNHSMSWHVNTIRGLHCQIAPFAQGKLVRCVRGAIWDVAVDVRPGSASYGRHVAVDLSAENWRQIWIPAGFLHGFCTLAADTEVIYKVTAPYDRDSERGVIWNDPTVALPWPLTGAPVLSDKDAALPGLASLTQNRQLPNRSC